MVETRKPKFVKSLGLYVCHGDVGYKLYNIIETGDAHISEGLTELYRNLMLYDNIEGFKVKIELLYSMRTGVELWKEAGRIRIFKLGRNSKGAFIAMIDILLFQYVYSVCV